MLKSRAETVLKEEGCIKLHGVCDGARRQEVTENGGCSRRHGLKCKNKSGNEQTGG